MRVILLLSLFALGACSGAAGLAMPSGEWRPLNAGKWTAGPNDLTDPPPPATSPMTTSAGHA